MHNLFDGRLQNSVVSVITAINHIHCAGCAIAEHEERMPQQMFRKLYDFYASQKIAVDAQLSLARLKDGENIAFLTPTELTEAQCDMLVAQMTTGGIQVINRMPVLN